MALNQQSELVDQQMQLLIFWKIQIITDKNYDNNSKLSYQKNSSSLCKDLKLLEHLI